MADSNALQAAKAIKAMSDEDLADLIAPSLEYEEDPDPNDVSGGDVDVVDDDTGDEYTITHIGVTVSKLP